jgi:hypothetical protein
MVSLVFLRKKTHIKENTIESFITCMDLSFEQNIYIKIKQDGVMYLDNISIGAIKR